MVGAEAYACSYLVFLLYLYVFVGVDVSFFLIPIEEIGEESFVLLVFDVYIAYEFSQLHVAEEVGCVAFDGCFNAQAVGVFFEICALFECPVFGVALFVYVPLFGFYLIADASGVADKSGYTVGA